MLIRFTIENFLSFHQEAEFNMLTGDIRRLPHHVYKHPKIDLLKNAVIYGGNGAGKSNLVIALDFLRNIVTEGDIDIFDDEIFYRLADMEDKPTKMYIEFVSHNKGFGYSLSFLKGRIQEESLHILNYGKKDDELVFLRTSNKKNHLTITLAEKYIKNDKDKVLIQVWEEDVLDKNVPFVSFASGKKYKEITSAYTWLSDGLFCLFPGMQFSGLVNKFVTDQNFKDFTNRIIDSFETGVKELDIQTLDFDVYFGEDNITERERVYKKIRNGETENVGDGKTAVAMMENGKPVVKKAVSYHENIKGEKIKFELSEESQGTLRIIDFIPVLYLLNNFPVTVIIDEIDQSIHPALLKEFVTQIVNHTERIGQIIFTTHESNLLDQEIFRQDEIWFAEKNKAGASNFYPLSDYDIRPDLDIRKGYLSGRFGAIPFLANLKNLSWEDYAKK